MDKTHHIAGIFASILICLIALTGPGLTTAWSAKHEADVPPTAEAPAVPDAPNEIHIPATNAPALPDKPGTVAEQAVAQEAEKPADITANIKTESAQTQPTPTDKPVQAKEEAFSAAKETADQTAETISDKAETHIAPAPEAAKPDTHEAAEALPAQTHVPVQHDAPAQAAEQTQVAQDHTRTDETHAAPTETHATVAETHPAKTDSHGTTGHETTIEAVNVSLADDATMTLLKTDFLKEHDTDLSVDFHPALSTVFWSIVAVVILMGASFIVLVVTGVFRNMKIAAKLYTSFGYLILTALILGGGSYYYLNHAAGFADMSMHFTEMDLIGAEIGGAQANFLLHGIENKEYGERRVEDINHGLKEIDELIVSIRDFGLMNEEMAQNLKSLEAILPLYKKDIEEVVHAFHEVEKFKEDLDELGEEMVHALEQMSAHHKELLAAAENSGTDMEEVKRQTHIVEELAEAEILLLKAAHNEVEFLLDKKPERVAAMEEEFGMFLGLIHLLETQMHEPKEVELLQTVEHEAAKFIKELKALIKDEAIIARDTGELDELLKQFEALGAELAHEAELMAEEAVLEADIAIIMLLAFALIFGIPVAVFIARLISKPVLQSAELAQTMAQGDLRSTVEYSSRDEVGTMCAALNDMTDRLSDIIHSIQEGAEGVASGSEELSATAQNLSQAVTEQASTVEEISSSMEQMGANISATNENAADTENIAKAVANDAKEGGSAVSQTVTAMREIAEKITIVEDIARQTNLLALNAAIEAARAGEHGKGFAVVAAEVRKLAERSGIAAGEISELSGSSLAVAEKAGRMLEKMVPEMQSTSEHIQEITTATNEQQAGISQIREATGQLDTVTQSNASASEEVASTSEELASQAEALQSNIAYFKIKESGANTLQVRALPGPEHKTAGHGVDVSDFDRY